MPPSSGRIQFVLHNPMGFAGEILSGFRANQGFLLAGALELTRHFLVWYFSTLSFVNVIYGTLATAVVILLSLEAAALIQLLGAQVIASYERIGIGNDRAGLRT